MMIYRDIARDKGCARRDDALGDAESRYGPHLLLVRRMLTERLLVYGRASLDDLDLPPDLRGRYLGAVHRPLVAVGAIVECGMTRCTRPAAHARRIVVWAVADYGALRQWLADHPAPVPGPLRQAELPWGDGGQA